MNDRELLDAAAKAAGIELTGSDRAAWVNGSSYGWNPLTDDGDALRLAVKLRMALDIGGGGQVQALCGEPECTEAVEDIEPDPCAATRRAIVRAAAEIGRAMK
jgi:hypothetical protein